MHDEAVTVLPSKSCKYFLCQKRCDLRILLIHEIINGKIQAVDCFHGAGIIDRKRWHDKYPMPKTLFISFDLLVHQSHCKLAHVITNIFSHNLADSLIKLSVVIVSYEVPRAFEA